MNFSLSVNSKNVVTKSNEEKMIQEEPPPVGRTDGPLMDGEKRTAIIIPLLGFLTCYSGAPGLEDIYNCRTAVVLPARACPTLYSIIKSPGEIKS